MTLAAKVNWSCWDSASERSGWEMCVVMVNTEVGPGYLLCTSLTRHALVGEVQFLSQRCSRHEQERFSQHRSR